MGQLILLIYNAYMLAKQSLVFFKSSLQVTLLYWKLINISVPFMIIAKQLTKIKGPYLMENVILQMFVTNFFGIWEKEYKNVGHLISYVHGCSATIFTILN